MWPRADRRSVHLEVGLAEHRRRLADPHTPHHGAVGCGDDGHVRIVGGLQRRAPFLESGDIRAAGKTDDPTIVWLGGAVGVDDQAAPVPISDH
jgi:hypothetical protein